MNVRRASPLLLALLGTLPATAACYDLSKASLGPRWIDDFSAGTATPTWSVFSRWGCGATLIQSTAPDGGIADGGAIDGGGADAAVDAAVAPLPSCPRGQGDTNVLDSYDTTGLEFSFDLPEDMGILGAVAETLIVPSAAPVDFTGFRQFVFSARLQSASTKNPLPAGTELRVLLGCSRNGKDHVASQTVPATIFTIDSTAWTSVHLDMSVFYAQQTSLSQTCLSEIDSVSFLVPPGKTDLPTFAGTLSLDNISLQNN